MIYLYIAGALAVVVGSFFAGCVYKAKVLAAKDAAKSALVKEINKL